MTAQDGVGLAAACLLALAAFTAGLAGVELLMGRLAPRLRGSRGLDYERDSKSLDYLEPPKAAAPRRTDACPCTDDSAHPPAYVHNEDDWFDYGVRAPRPGEETPRPAPPAHPDRPDEDWFDELGSDPRPYG